ncbi:MAG: leucyl/phenylalanyl-tRNA--protein transferase [Acidovorax sp.]|jgi:leucyl/phenylalanyl-tRNA---protein transferase|uniref:leucyl/phenylalanyl-tRNA--protein transferase n=1 Tax=Acidovorax sp. TaxID=1872122 RepID=UPI002628D873|nr:leucyl/phenylalanyl-tRNA--protein transferase [Acidovorax sp.]MDH4463198.1 leucyl/phenylalanyl-tRNA--protein transferase [Acidovorax sp.]
MDPPLPWLSPGDPFPPPDAAWNENSEAPGLLAAGGSLDVETLRRAYTQGTFPWFSKGQPILWWAPDPRMVLRVDQFKLHPSFIKTLKKFRASPVCTVTVDKAFAQVIRACATHRRNGQNGTWIVPAMVTAYEALHAQGLAHSVETWIDGELVGGLYCVALGHAVFGESMFARVTDASKIALAGLVCITREHGVPWIDCQQNTRHLASLGAREMPRDLFIAGVQSLAEAPSLRWDFKSVYWSQLLPN